MALPATFDVITVQGEYVDFTGAPPVDGELIWEPSADMIKHIGSDVLIFRRPRSAAVAPNGTWNLQVPITNDPDVVPAFQYDVTEKLNGAVTRVVRVEIPISLLPGPVNFADLVVIGEVPTGTTALTKVVADTLYAPLGGGGSGAAETSEPTAGTLALRDGSGRSKFGVPSDADHAATKGYVDSLDAAQGTAITTLGGNMDNLGGRMTSVETALPNKADLVGGVIPTAQIPPLAINETFTAASQAAMLALTAQRGDMAIRTDNGRTYVLSADGASTLANWKEVMAAGQVASVAGKTGVVTLVKADVGLTNVDDTSDANKPVSTAQQTAFNLKANLNSPTFTGTVGGITKTMVGLPNVDNTSDANKPISTAQAAVNALKADLVGGVIPTSQLPPLAINETFVAADQAAMLALTAQRGDMAIRTDNGRTYVLSADAPGTLANWKEVMAAGQVQSVAGKTGVVTLVKADVGLNLVDNTADSAKPVSTAQQTALDLKAPLATSLGVRTKSGGVWPARPPHVVVMSIGADPSPLDQNPGDLRSIPVV